MAQEEDGIADWGRPCQPQLVQRADGMGVQLVSAPCRRDGRRWQPQQLRLRRGECAGSSGYSNTCGADGQLYPPQQPCGQHRLQQPRRWRRGGHYNRSHHKQRARACGRLRPCGRPAGGTPAETTAGGRADGGDQGGSTVWSESHLVRA